MKTKLKNVEPSLIGETCSTCPYKKLTYGGQPYCSVFKGKIAFVENRKLVLKKVPVCQSISDTYKLLEQK